MNYLMALWQKLEENKMTLWVFGDSFAQMKDNTPEQWMQKAATDLGTTPWSMGLNGSSLEFTYHRFNIARKKIEGNDVVVLVLTGLDRRWFFKDFPGHNSNTSPRGDKKETKAIELYREHLDFNPDVHKVYLIDFLFNVHALTEKLNLHTIIIANFLDVYDFLLDKRNRFPLFNFANGILLDVSMYEYTYEFFDKDNQGKTYGDNDRRLNHLLKTNHLILAKKIVENVKNKTTIDLTTEFEKHLMSEDAVNDPTFSKNELFQ